MRIFVVINGIEKKMYHLNANGLSNGSIPAKTICPFLKECGLKTEECPSETSLKEKPYSCAAARAWSMLIIQDNALLRKIHTKSK